MSGLHRLPGYYINLEDRQDRDKHITENIIGKYDIFSDLQRFNAVKHSNGALGCSLSHLCALEKCMNNMNDTNEQMFVILEDDFCILEESNFRSFIENFERIKDSNTWDCIILTPRGDTMNSDANMNVHNFQRIRNNQTTTGYIVKREFASLLTQNIREGIQHMCNGVNLDICAIDQYWKRLQDDYRFYYYIKVYGGQLEGYSSIEKRDVNYNNRFMEQK